MAKPFYITTPIYYVNDRPHIGHAYTTIAADLLTRFNRLLGRDSFFLTGTDEHGTKIAEAAAKTGKDPQQFCDDVVVHFKDAWKSLSLDYSDFIRTTEERHIKAVERFLSVLNDARTEDGQEIIYPDVYEGLYCTGCEKFMTDKDLVDGVCPDHKIPPQVVKEKNYFFRLSAFADKLKRLIENNDIEIQPEERRREVLGLFEIGLPDFSISREKVAWGIPLPFDKKQVTYVWIEALCNYITGIGYGADEDKFKKWWYEAETVHLMAKDILKFHCIFWPAMLMAAGLPLPKRMFLHGFFTVDGSKMSKSLGNIISPQEMVDQFGPDGTRYLLLTQYPFGKDGDIQSSRFITKYNSDLANDLGNLVSRVAKMIVSNFNGNLPEPVEDIEGYDELVAEVEKLPEKVTEYLNDFKIGAAIEESMNMVRQTNRFFDNNAPWKLVKQNEMKKAGGVLYACAEILRVVSILLYPVMPNKTRDILSIFGLGEEVLEISNARTFYYLKPGIDIAIDKSVFPRLKEKKAKEEKAAVNKTDKAGDGLLDISEFGKLQLVVAEILKAEKVEGADKLLKLQIDIGTEKRQIVAGIAEHYAPDDLIGKKIIVVKNLKPAKIRGVESNGMLLAAKKGKHLTIVSPSGDIPTGASVS